SWQCEDSRGYNSIRSLLCMEYRLVKSFGEWRIPEEEDPVGCCCGKCPGWLEGSHPSVTEGEVKRRVCFTRNGNIIPESGMSTSGSSQSNNSCLDIKVKNCIGYFVYLLKPAPSDHTVYCTGSTLGDPCVNHTILDQPWRSTDCSLEECSNYMNDEIRTEGWYRFKRFWSNFCETNRTIKVRNCGDFFVYWLKPTDCCKKVYCTDLETPTNGCPKGTLTSEIFQEPSLNPTSGTSSDIKKSTSEEANDSSTGEPTQEPSTVRAGDTSTGERHSESSTRTRIPETSSAQEKQPCSVKRLPTKEDCEKMINTVQVLYVGQNNQGSSEDYLRLVREMLREQTPCKYVLSKLKS
ncbi:uncharacterized protein, partial [Hemitrygon akajei]|uniref:uncharacterized protein n=1 Tax=Hemitrygon akajei TaxID=2704970 RepID=UPI003BFA0754